MKPILRAVKYRLLRQSAARRARAPGPYDEVPTPAPVAWVIGCGRSGTTLLGRILSLHPDVHYLFEPYHLWAAIDRTTDFINFHHRVDGRCLMDAADGDEEARRRFGRLMIGPLRRSGRRVLIEKTPINTMRIGYLERLAPDAKFVHLVRDGYDVARSIARLASTNTYRIAGRPEWNQWWGDRGVKWDFLLRDGIAAGYFPEDAPGLTSDAQRGVYEWLVSLGEVDRWRSRLNGRLHELTYDELTSHPRESIRGIGEFLGLETTPGWLDSATAAVAEPKSGPGPPVELPAAIDHAVSVLRERYGFANRVEEDHATAT